MEQIGILGGTFDPPHIGHLIIAEIVKDSLGLNEVWFIPTNEPPHKETANSSTTDRVNMLNLAIENNESFFINTIEVDRAGKSYSIDTITELKTKHPDKQFYFIIGADMVDYLPKWYEIERLLNLVTFVGVKRQGYELSSKYKIRTVDIPLIEIASSEVRRRISNNQTVKYFLPEKVRSYIEERNLYEN